MRLRVMTREDHVRNLVGLCDVLAPKELRNGCDDPQQVYEGEWSRCGGCQQCMLDQMRSLVDAIRASDQPTEER